ncbi:ABC transporter substrate-binding protein [Neoroseomonas lacus]|uniref:Amino acid ABC transporter substrate-binding protein n=1 Tax=Neoroseomonas lacus TaxID=287609 RepID=A0A917NWZ4_9PROT|nr:ABC transporter substrate-binding protein [Neoroseomonas lacus]GGJ33151.1 amino acid ABC transporter substrate-binding protein [Neoroseomonas lacus]
MKITRRPLLAAPALMLAGRAQAQGAPIKVGTLLPLTGVAASAGNSAKAAIELAVELVNTPRPDLASMPLMATTGFPAIGGRPLEVVIADQQGSPSVAQNQALRLITQERVVALTNGYQSGLAQTASAIAERHGIPYVNGESVATNLTERGFRWFFRTTPIGPDIAAIYVEFLKAARIDGRPVSKIAIVNENTEYGTSIADVIRRTAEQGGISIELQIPYAANSADVSAQVLQLKGAQPDVVIFISYTSDAILYARTMRAQGYRPPILIGDNSGFSDDNFVQTAGDIAQGLINRSAFDPSRPGSNSFKINALYKARTGREMDDTTARMMQGFLVACDAINRAGSTQPAAIQAALRATDLSADQLMIGYRGVKFDDKGQNTKASVLLVQLRGREYVSVWPTETATAQLQLPYKGWE